MHNMAMLSHAMTMTVLVMSSRISFCKNELTDKVPLARKVLLSYINGNKDK